MNFISASGLSRLSFHVQRPLEQGLSNVSSILVCAIWTAKLYCHSKGFAYNSNKMVCSPVLLLANTDGADVGDVVEQDEELFLPNIQCPAGFQIYDVGTDGTLTCLKQFYYGETYQGATSVCQSLGGHLVSVKTPVKLELIKTLSDYQDLWVGLDDMEHEGLFIWQVDGKRLTNEEISALFADGEPNNLSIGREDCVHIIERHGLLNDIECSHSFHFICETFFEKIH